MSKPSYELAVGTHLISTKPGRVSLAVLLAAAADATLVLYNTDVASDIATTNKMITFGIDVSLNGFQGGGNINDPLEYSSGLVAVVAGAEV